MGLVDGLSREEISYRKDSKHQKFILLDKWLMNKKHQFNVIITVKYFLDLHTLLGGLVGEEVNAVSTEMTNRQLRVRLYIAVVCQNM